MMSTLADNAVEIIKQGAPSIGGVASFRFRDEALRYFLSDHLGTAQMEFASGGWPVWKGEFAPFGQELDTQFTANHYKFAGLEHDSESDLDHTPFRQYASVTGRWMSPDPYNGSMDPSNPQSFNRYSYVLNSPLLYTDPTGQSVFCRQALSMALYWVSPVRAMQSEMRLVDHCAVRFSGTLPVGWRC
jgi:RHS repeat-associated protein